MSELTPALRDLAHAHRVATDYWSWHGEHVEVSAETVRSVLGALGVPCADDEEVAASVEAASSEPWRRVLPPVVVTRAGWTPWVPVHVADGTGVSLTVELEDGSSRDLEQVDHYVPPRELEGERVGEATFVLPGDLPTGWHRLVASLEAPALDPQTTTATLVVTPARVSLPPALDERPAVGLMAQLYQARSAESWGVGDLGDLATLAEWAGRDLGADFVLVNPLHAAEPVPPMEPSPYLPTSRRFVNPLYLRVADIPEYASLGPEARARVEALADQGRALNATETIDRDASWALKREALALVHAAGLSPVRAAELQLYRVREGGGLLAFATWCAVAEVYGVQGGLWPHGIREGDPLAVAEVQAAHADLVDFHVWLQWLLEEQLAAVQQRALAAGMRLGVVHDLAVGVHPIGADAWGLGDALAKGVSVGAPPDQYSQLGQNWSQPPWRPDRLAELGYAPFRDLVRTVLRDSGGVRVDHILGMFRLWWIPDGSPAAEGAYVYYDEEALLGILALEAERAGAVLVGEDLGVVPPNLRDVLLDRGLLGTSILFFEWVDGRPRWPDEYRSLALTSVTTHDLPPTAGYLELEHVRVRDELGLLTIPVEEERAHEQASLDRVRQTLRELGLLGEDATVEETVVALHRFVGRTPSRLRGVALADVVGDRRTVNQPGTNREYPNWCVPLSGPDGIPLLLEDVLEAPLARTLFDAARNG